MTKLLEHAFNKVSQLSEKDQDDFAKWVLEELEMEKKWENIFANSENILDNLVKEAVNDYEQGQTKNLDIDKL